MTVASGMATILVFALALQRPPASVSAGDTRNPFAGALMPPDVRAPEFRLRTQDDKPISMADVRRSVAIVTFA